MVALRPQQQLGLVAGNMYNYILGSRQRYQVRASVPFLVMFVAKPAALYRV